MKRKAERALIGKTRALFSFQSSVENRLRLLLRVRWRRNFVRLPGEEAPLAVFFAPDGEEVEVVDHRLAVVGGVNHHAAVHQYDAGRSDDEVAFLVIERLVGRALARQ